MSADQVRTLAIDVLTEVLPLEIRGYRYTDHDIYNVVVAAAVQQRSIESVCQQLVQAPSANLVRHYLAERLFTRFELEMLEARCNALLTARLPADLLRQRAKVALDLHLVPYYGAPAYGEDELRRGEAKAGTTRFHCYASAYVIRGGRRLTLAVSFVWAEDELVDVLQDLLRRLETLGLALKRLLLDRGFASVAVFHFLERRPFTSVVALPKRGARLKGLLQGRRSFRTSYTMQSAEEGSVAFPLWVACRYAAGRRGKHGIEYLAFAVLGRAACARPVLRLADEYRQRFGIETSYRVMHRVRPCTTSRAPELRLLLACIGWLLVNLWVWLKAQVAAHAPRGQRAAARRWLEHAFRLDRFCDLLLTAITALYQVRSLLLCPFPLASPLKL